MHKQIEFKQQENCSSGHKGAACGSKNHLPGKRKGGLKPRRVFHAESFHLKKARRKFLKPTTITEMGCLHQTFLRAGYA